MGWFIENRANKNEEVEGLIISGFPEDSLLRYALASTFNIKQKMYYLGENGEPNFVDPEDPLVDFLRRPEHYKKPIRKDKDKLQSIDRTQ